jgi:hypothetical protein
MSRQLRHSWRLVRDLAYPWSQYQCRTCGADVQAPYGPPSTMHRVRWQGLILERFERRPDCTAQSPTIRRSTWPA